MVQRRSKEIQEIKLFATKKITAGGKVHIKMGCFYALKILASVAFYYLFPLTEQITYCSFYAYLDQVLHGK